MDNIYHIDGYTRKIEKENQELKEALRRIERQSRILSESGSPFTINEIAKKALKGE